MKYELVKENTISKGNTTLYQIRALEDIDCIKKGDLGGYVESEYNLSQEGTCWVDNTSSVYGNAIVCENAFIGDKSVIAGYLQGISYDCPTPLRATEVGGNVHIYRSTVFCGAHVYGGVLEDETIASCTTITTNEDFLVIKYRNKWIRAYKNDEDGHFINVLVGTAIMDLNAFYFLEEKCDRICHAIDSYFRRV